jgi:hypothetical protein
MRTVTVRGIMRIISCTQPTAKPAVPPRRSQLDALVLLCALRAVLCFFLDVVYANRPVQRFWCAPPQQWAHLPKLHEDLVVRAGAYRRLLEPDWSRSKHLQGWQISQPTAPLLESTLSLSLSLSAGCWRRWRACHTSGNLPSMVCVYKSLKNAIHKQPSGQRSSFPSLFALPLPLFIPFQLYQHAAPVRDAGLVARGRRPAQDTVRPHLSWPPCSLDGLFPYTPGRVLPAARLHGSRRRG